MPGGTEVAVKKFRGEPWAEFLAGLKDGSIWNPFVVREDAGNGSEGWFLYGSSDIGIVYVLTSRKERRFWKTLDGLLADIKRGIPNHPMLEVHANTESVRLSKNEDRKPD